MFSCFAPIHPRVAPPGIRLSATPCHHFPPEASHSGENTAAQITVLEPPRLASIPLPGTFAPLKLNTSYVGVVAPPL